MAYWEVDLDIQRLRCQTTVPLDDTSSPRAVVQVHVIQEQKKDGCNIHRCSFLSCFFFLIFIYTPEKARQKYRHGERGGNSRVGGKVEEAHTKKGGGLNSPTVKVFLFFFFEGLCLLEWRGVDRFSLHRRSRRTRPRRRRPPYKTLESPRESRCSESHSSWTPWCRQCSRHCEQRTSGSVKMTTEHGDMLWRLLKYRLHRSPCRVTGSVGRGPSSDVDVTDGTLCHLYKKKRR